MTNPCPKQNIFWRLLVWHFWHTPQEIIKGWFNLLRFNLRWFSTGLLLKTLFSHWRHYRDSYGRGFDLKAYAQALVGNLISRLLGAFIRLIVIIVSLIAEATIFFGGLFLLMAWLLMPIIIILAIWSGVFFLLS